MLIKKLGAIVATAAMEFAACNTAPSTSPSSTVTRQTLASSSQRAPSTTVLNRMCLRTSNLSATSSAYCLISGPGVNSRDQFGFGSKK